MRAARQRRRHRVPPGAAVHHPGGAGQGRRGHAAHPAAGARLHRAARVPAHDLPAGHATGAAVRNGRPVRPRSPSSRPRRPLCRAAPARRSSGPSPRCSSPLWASAAGSWRRPCSTGTRTPGEPAPRRRPTARATTTSRAAQAPHDRGAPTEFYARSATARAAGGQAERLRRGRRTPPGSPAATWAAPTSATSRAQGGQSASSWTSASVQDGRRRRRRPCSAAADRRTSCARRPCASSVVAQRLLAAPHQAREGIRNNGDAQASTSR